VTVNEVNKFLSFAKRTHNIMSFLLGSTGTGFSCVCVLVSVLFFFLILCFHQSALNDKIINEIKSTKLLMKIL
jgi:hypothetical protein